MTNPNPRPSRRAALCYLLFPLLGFVAGSDCEEQTPPDPDRGDVVTGVVWVKGSGGYGTMWGMSLDGDLATNMQGAVFLNSDTPRGLPYVAPEQSPHAYLLWVEAAGATSTLQVYEEDDEFVGSERVLVNDGGFVTAGAISGANADVVYASNVSGDMELYKRTSTEPLRLTNRVGVDGSPDITVGGTWVVYNAHVGSPGLSEIMIMSANGGDPVNLTNHEAQDVNPRFSRDATKIVFSSNRNGNYDIFMMNFDGSGLEQLTTSPNDESVPSLSPDMRYLIYNLRQGADIEIYALELSTGITTNLSNDPGIDDISPHCGVFRLGA